MTNKPLTKAEPPEPSEPDRPPGVGIFFPKPSVQTEIDPEHIFELPKTQNKNDRLYLDQLAWSEKHSTSIVPGTPIRVGLDLGTASVVLVVLDSRSEPLAMARQKASVVRDGLVVDFAGALAIGRFLRQTTEEALGVKLTRAAIAVPPGTGERDAATHCYVCEGAGLEVDQIFEEPTAANFFLGLKNGAIADLGGGTTGAAVLSDRKLIASFDEPTGGHHLSLVLAGHFKYSLERAENFKLDPVNRDTIAPVVAPVLSKMGRILKDGLAGHDVPLLCLVGGSAAAPGAGPIIAQETGLPVQVFYQPELITPLGIAMGCNEYPAEKL
ncbi:MAG: ethanolamine utilization protein EutJ [Deltaproteobacteria bacterium]|jgi:ethanolamine utilization protein EutJ|nr:ethanolamine utilization protein EutJ [Deltaproteobacteria bacterium]